MLRMGCRIIGANECRLLLSVHPMHLLMRECHGILRTSLLKARMNTATPSDPVAPYLIVWERRRASRLPFGAARP